MFGLESLTYWPDVVKNLPLGPSTASQPETLTPHSNALLADLSY